MQVIIKHLKDNPDYRQGIQIFIDGEQVFYALDGEPEDNSLARNFSDCYQIESMLRKAHAVGYCGESIEVQNIKVDLEEF